MFSGQEFIYEYPNGDVVANVIAAYISKHFRGTIMTAEEEGYEVRFFKLSELPKDLSPPDRPIIEQYLGSLEDNDDINEQSAHQPMSRL